MLQIVAAAQVRALINEISISFDGVTNSATPILCDMMRQTSAGTSSALAIRKTNNGDQETLQTSCIYNFTAEPTDDALTPLWAELIHPQTGLTWQAPYGQEIAVQGGTRLGLRVTAPAGVNCVMRMKGQE
jgi:hypothetical protein